MGCVKPYQTILIDPPWPLVLGGGRSRKKGGPAERLPYSTMRLDELLRLPVRGLAGEGSHLWLWTTNQTIEDGFLLMRAWGFRYLSIIHAIKPSGFGNYFIQRTQSLLFGYFEKCRFPRDRYLSNIIEVPQPKRHSEKWDETYSYIERVSPGPRVELFARRVRPGWDVWGNEVDSDITFSC